MKKTVYYNTGAMQIVATRKQKYTYLYVTRESLKWMRIYRVENLDVFGNERFTKTEDILESFNRCGAGINMHDTCFELVEHNDFK